MEISDIRDFVAVDFETATSDRMICQIGITVVENLEIVDTLTMLIQPPGNKYEQMCMSVHHITPSHTYYSPTLRQVWNRLAPYFQNRIIVAHNSAFDEDALRKNLRYYGLPDDGIGKFYCTYCLFNSSLKCLCYAYDMDVSGHHDAGFDAECCATFFINYIRGIEPDYTKVPDELIRKPKKRSFTIHERVQGDVLKKDLTNADPNNPFYDKKVVITGLFPVSRSSIANELKSFGADVDHSVTKRTAYVLAGSEPGWKKMEQIDKFNAEGASINVISWEDYNEMIK